MIVTETASLSDTLTPFLIDRASVRGRIVRLASVSHTILTRYAYPPAITRLLGEWLIVAAMLSSNLKQEGIFTLQIKGNGPLPMLVVDAEYGGALRGYADINEAAREAILAFGPTPSLKQLVGEEAYLAITLDPGAGMQRYQGVVAIEHNTVVETLQQYFTQSQQLDVVFKLAAGEVLLPATSQPLWVAGGMMIERLPEQGGAAPASHDPLHISEEQRESWRYAAAMLGTVKENELLDAMLDASQLLHRLFHEEGVWVYPPQPLSVGCRCSRERILALLSSMSPAERAEMLQSGPARVHCQFCNKTELFTASDLNIPVV